MQTAILWGILILVLIVLPIALGRLGGKSPMEVFFGSRVKGTGFDKASGEAGAKKEKGKDAPLKERNSGKEDLLQAVSDLVSYARRNHFALLVPGTLQVGGKTANLAAILITRSRVVGINGFGYGGSIQAYPGEDPWTQTRGGQKQTFESPVAKNRAQLAILKAALSEAGFGEVDCEVLGVFTAPSAVLKSAGKSGCYTREGLLTRLREEAYLRDGGLVPEALRGKLDGMVLRVVR